MKSLKVLAFVAAANFAVAAPTFEFNPKNTDGNKSETVQIIFKQDAANPTVAYSFNFSLTLPSGVTATGFLADDAALCEQKADGSIQISKAATSALRDGKVACDFTLDTTGVTTGSVTAVVNKSGYDFDDGNGQVNVPFTMEPIIIGTPVALVSFTCPANATCSIANDDHPAGTAVTITPAKGYEVNGKGDGVAVTLKVEDKVTVSAVTSSNVTFTCPANATCSIADGDYPADTDVTITPAKGYQVNGKGDGVAVTLKVGEAATISQVGGGNPPQIGEAKPVPAIGLFGLFGLLASIFGAAAMVLRRK